MSRSATLAPGARRDAATEVRWLARRNPDAARKLRLAIVDAARLLGARPLAGRRQPDLIGARFRLWSLNGFPYVLVYDPERIPPEILRMAHMARDLRPLLAELAVAPGTNTAPG